MPDLKMEQELIRSGMDRVAGIDEAGRGPLAGPVTCLLYTSPSPRD